jgi:two-component system, cell cycle sensor histidine kinase and response regulator CckA
MNWRTGSTRTITSTGRSWSTSHTTRRPATRRTNKTMTVRSIPAHENGSAVETSRGDVSRLEAALRASEDRLRQSQADYDRLKAEFLQAQKMEAIGRMASGVTHDFKNVLTLIAGYSHLLLDRVDAPDLREAVVEIQGACQRAIGLAQQLLSFSRKEAGDRAPLSLATVLADNAKMVHRMLGASIDVTIRSEPSLGLVMASAGQMHQVILNLVVNARDAMPGGGRVVIDARNVDVAAGSPEARGGAPVGAFVLLSVADTGTGMDETTRLHALEPFFTTKEARTGTGLGLSTVHSVVTDCQGRIILDSVPGGGTTVMIYLPRLAREDAPVATPGAGDNRSSPPSRLRRIALLDEDEGVRRLLTDLLVSAGYEAFAAQADGRGGDGRTPSPCDLVIADLTTLGRSGEPALRALRETSPSVKIIGLAGSSGSRGGSSSNELGVGVTIAKPIVPRQLLRAVRDALEAD